MPAMTLRRLGLALAAAGWAAAAGAVGLGPLTKEGMIDGPSEGFYLTVYNPYAETTAFTLYAIGFDDDTPQPRVAILPGDLDLGPQRSRQILVVANELVVGETYRFRVCAERKTPPDGMNLHARVCSKLTSRRIG